MKLHRPYIPLDIRLQVALRQLFGESRYELDHDPALVNRRKVYYSNGDFAGYDPPANDPDYLFYRLKTDHDIKTRVRGDGAQLSDLGLRRKLKRIARKKKTKWKPRRAKVLR